MPASSFQQQKLRVCEVCSAYLGLHDNDRRLADHFGGKLHLGFIEIREKLEKLRVRMPWSRSVLLYARVLISTTNVSVQCYKNYSKGGSMLSCIQFSHFINTTIFQIKLQSDKKHLRNKIQNKKS